MGGSQTGGIMALTALDLVILLLMLLPAAFLIGLMIYNAIPSVRKEWREAEERAEKLVQAVLTEDEYRRLRRDGYLDVPSPTYPNRVYRIPAGQGTVVVLERGRCVARLCAHPTVPIPARESVIVHKLMIEGNEKDYLLTANHIPC
jgi:hypothetical protein